MINLPVSLLLMLKTQWNVLNKVLLDAVRAWILQVWSQSNQLRLSISTFGCWYSFSAFFFVAYAELAEQLPYIEISDHHPKDIVASQGKTFSLNCPNKPIKGVNLTVEWFRNNIKLNESDTYHKILSNGTLLAISIKSGLIAYQCSQTYHAKNLLEPMVFLSRTARIDVIGNFNNISYTNVLII